LSVGTVYQNTTGTKLVVVAKDNTLSLTGYIGASSGSLTAVALETDGTSNGTDLSITFIVPPGYYYKITNNPPPGQTSGLYRYGSGPVTASAWQICEGGSSATLTGTVGGGCALSYDVNSGGYTDSCWGDATTSSNGGMTVCPSGYTARVSGAYPIVGSFANGQDITDQNWLQFDQCVGN
jgi:hypothetical protein